MAINESVISYISYHENHSVNKKRDTEQNAQLQPYATNMY